MDKWSEMQAFVTAVQQEGFSAAGRQLGLSPSAVSKLISRLEKRVGVRLLNRTTRTISLTEAGHDFYQRCNEILHELDDAETALTAFSDSPKGCLKINCSPGFAKHQLLPLLPAFQELYPDLSLELQLTGQAVDLVSEGVDLAIRLGALSDSSLVARKLGESRRIVCASPEYLKSHGVPETPDDLENHQCLGLSTMEAFNHWNFNRDQESFHLNIKGGFVTDNVEALYEYALMGGGVVRLAAFMLQEAIAEKRLIPLLSEYETDPQWVHVVYPHRKFLAAKVRVFVDYLLQHFSDQRW